MSTPSFFAVPPKAERAFLSAYKGEELRGRFGIRIELEPLWFTDGIESPAREAEVILDYLALPLILPAELENTSFVPDEGRYEGSCYFRGQHNWVDIKEIRFWTAEGETVVAEYDLVLHLPIAPPDECSLVLSACTKIVPDTFTPGSPRFVPGLGTFVESKADYWECEGMYDGKSIRIELSADGNSFDSIALYAKAVIAENAISPSDIRRHIASWLGFLKEKFDRFKIKTPILAEDFVPKSFYFYRRRHHDIPELIIVLSHPADMGHWSASFEGTKGWDLNWTPK